MSSEAVAAYVPSARARAMTPFLFLAMILAPAMVLVAIALTDFSEGAHSSGRPAAVKSAQVVSNP